MEFILFLIISILSLIATVLFRKKLAVIAGLMTSLAAGTSFYLLWHALSMSGRNFSYYGRLGIVAPIIYIVLILIGLILGVYKFIKGK